MLLEKFQNTLCFKARGERQDILYNPVGKSLAILEVSVKW